MTKKEITDLRKKADEAFGGVQYAVNGSLLVSEYRVNMFLDLLSWNLDKEWSKQNVGD